MAMRLMLCFPPAGAGASFFHPWIGQSSELTVHPVELPGREKRFAEAPCESLPALINGLLPELLAQADDAEQIVVFGHSFGTLLAYETTRALLARAPGLDVTLVVSGAGVPGRRLADPVTGLPDDEFVARVRHIAGYHHPAWDEPELREMLLPALRADMRMYERYRPTGQQPLSCPILAVRGNADTLVAPDALDGWQRLTTGEFHRAEIDGGHMYLVEGWPTLLELVDRQLRPRQVSHG
ncbi:MAG TPA: alpha/beta fold hydrolase [Pseudonocardiaceae bacterium]